MALKPEVLRSLLEGMIREKIRAQVVVDNQGMVQGADLRPASLRDDGAWIFLAEEDCGVHLRLSRVCEVRLQKILWPEGTHWVLKTYVPEGRMVCVLAPPRVGGRWTGMAFYFKPPPFSTSTPLPHEIRKGWEKIVPAFHGASLISGRLFPGFVEKPFAIGWPVKDRKGGFHGQTPPQKLRLRSQTRNG